MADKVPVQDITATTLSEAMSAAVQSGINVRAIEDFLESIDWSGYQNADPGVRESIRRVEQLMSDYSEGELDGPGFVSALNTSAITTA